MTTAHIFGAGGHARVIASTVRHLHASVAFLTIEEEEVVLENPERFRDTALYLGIGNNARRRALFDRLLTVGLTPTTCISPDASVASNVEIGAGSVICAGAVIVTGVVLGCNVIVNTLSSVDHDNQIGDHTQITAGVTLGGDVRVGVECFFGIKSAVLPQQTLGDRVTVMGGTLVHRSYPSDVTVGGNPSMLLRSDPRT